MRAGQDGLLLRQEGLYSSHLTDWRRERDAGALAALAPRRRGPAPRADAAEQKLVQKLKGTIKALELRLHQANHIIEFQKSARHLGDPSRLSPREHRAVALQLTVSNFAVAVFFPIASRTCQNMFASFGGVPPLTDVRDGRLRCRGAFAPAILAGCF